MRQIVLVGWVGLAQLCACQGEIEDTSDAAVADLWVWPDSPAVDTMPGGQEAGGDIPQVGDQGPLVDKGPPADAPGPCASWSAWTCTTDPTYLCKATCQVTGLKLNCVSSGQCVCGIGVSPCGPFTVTNACDACKQAVEQGCCN